MTKQCPKCLEILPASSFNKSNRRDGLQTYCRSCHNKIQREKYALDPSQKIKRQVRERKRKSKNPLAKKNSELQRLYGISIDQYVELFSLQGEVCKICKQNCKTKKSLSVDHDHLSGKIRGLLCNRCNRAIGMFEDSPELLGLAARYLLDNG
jgi:hypothetical protein